MNKFLLSNSQNWDNIFGGSRIFRKFFTVIIHTTLSFTVAVAAVFFSLLLILQHQYWSFLIGTEVKTIDQHYWSRFVTKTTITTSIRLGILKILLQQTNPTRHKEMWIYFESNVKFGKIKRDFKMTDFKMTDFKMIDQANWRMTMQFEVDHSCFDN